MHNQAELLKVISQFHSPEYIRHNSRRFEHLASLRLPLKNSSVLEIGAGIGEHSMFFLDRGCSVTAIEARAENCLVYQQLLTRLMDLEQHTERVRLIHADAESFQHKIKGSFEIVYCYGLLYHLADPAAALKTMASYTQRLFLLETRVSYEEHEALNPVSEDASNPMFSYHGPGCRPTRPWVLARLKELYPYVYLPVTQPAHFEYPLDWTRKADYGTFEAPTRAIFIGSASPLDNPLLVTELPMQQMRE